MGDFCWDHLPATCFFDALHVDNGLDEVAGLILHEEQGVLQVFEPMEFMGQHLVRIDAAALDESR